MEQFARKSINCKKSIKNISIENRDAGKLFKKI
jgi:hypothetical protein